MYAFLNKGKKSKRKEKKHKKNSFKSPTKKINTKIKCAKTNKPLLSSNKKSRTKLQLKMIRLKSKTGFKSLSKSRSMVQVWYSQTAKINSTNFS